MISIVSRNALRHLAKLLEDAINLVKGELARLDHEPIESIEHFYVARDGDSDDLCLFIYNKPYYECEHWHEFDDVHIDDRTHLSHSLFPEIKRGECAEVEMVIKEMVYKN